ncbi:uncharacterized protein isoform X2 [Choristoneura fumiferana]|uniref:uncharacterized protein isoform X2 n=1 Tax=Choristoneura fumiferana TaxID=7141 RepID=UPI003D15955C
MSQSRTRRAGSGAREPARPSGDIGPNPQQRHRSTNRNKIPKSIRYDLENALLGLCDVWFEEIKPHLIQNNIKLHVEGAADGGVAADGDHRRTDPACAHLDPGAAFDQRQRRTAGCAACCQTQPTASRAPCRRLPSRCPPAPLSPPPPPKPKQLQYGRAAANCGGQPRPPRLLPSLRSSAEAATKHTAVHTNQRANSATQTRAESKSKRKKAPPLPEVSAQDAWRVPRLCRIYAPKMELPRTRTTSPSPPRHSVTKVSPELQPLPRGSHGRLKETLKSWKKHEQPKENIDMNGTPAPTFSVKHEKKKKIRDEDSSLFSPARFNQYNRRKT